MEITLNKKNLRLYYKQAEGAVTHEERSEIIVPDSLPDVGRVIDSDGIALLRGKDCADGKITVSGIVRANIAYEPEGGGSIRSLAAQIPFSVVILDAKAAYGAKVTANTRVTNIFTTLLNSRKLQITPEIFVSAEAYDHADISIPDDSDCDACRSLESLIETVELNPITDIRERGFSISDECGISTAAPPIAALIHSSVNVQYDDYRVAGAKLIIKGAAAVRLVYVTADSGLLHSEDVSIPFSEVIDMTDGEDNENKTFSVTPVPTGIYVQEQGGDYAKSVSVEIPVTAQVIVRKKLTVSYVTDAYSTAVETENLTETHRIVCLDSEQSLKDTVRETLHTVGVPASIVCARVYPGEIISADDGYAAAFRVCVTYCAEDGQTHTVCEKSQALFAFPDRSQGGDAAVEAVFGDVYAAIVAGGIEARVPVELKIKIFSTRELNTVSGITVNEESVKSAADAPSLTIIKVGGGDTLWTLAKRYNSTRKLICEANGLRDSVSVTDGDVLIIAKRRV